VIGRPVERTTSLVIRFDGPTPRAGDTGEAIATPADDGTWRTPDGVVTDGLELPEPQAAPSGQPGGGRAPQP
jgi:hypothetical protein